MAPTEDKIRSVMHRYVDCLNARDVPGIIELFATEGTVEDPVGSGVENAASGLTRLVGGLPAGSTFTLDTPVRGSHNGSGAAMAFTVHLPLPDQTLSIKSIDVMQFDDDGLITEMKAYYGPTDIKPA